MSFSSDEINEIKDMMEEPFDSFKEQILIYRTPHVAYISNDTNFIFTYGEEQPAVSHNYETRSGIFYATVEYLDNLGQQEILYPRTDSPVTVPKNVIRISVTGDAQAYLEDVQKIVIDGTSFEPASDHWRRGIFDRKYYDYFFQKIR